MNNVDFQTAVSISKDKGLVGAVTGILRIPNAQFRIIAVDITGAEVASAVIPKYMCQRMEKTGEAIKERLDREFAALGDNRPKNSVPNKPVEDSKSLTVVSK